MPKSMISEDELEWDDTKTGPGRWVFFGRNPATNSIEIVTATNDSVDVTVKLTGEDAADFLLSLQAWIEQL